MSRLTQEYLLGKKSSNRLFGFLFKGKMNEQKILDCSNILKVQHRKCALFYRLEAYICDKKPMQIREINLSSHLKHS